MCLYDRREKQVCFGACSRRYNIFDDSKSRKISNTSYTNMICGSSMCGGTKVPPYVGSKTPVLSLSRTA